MWCVRFAAGRVISRPNFAAVTAGVNLNGTTLTGDGGNPDLEPFRANQYDLSFEWYPDRRDDRGAGALFQGYPVLHRQ